MRFDREFIALNVNVTAMTGEEIEGILEQNHIHIGKEDIVTAAQNVENCHRFHVHLVSKRILVEVGSNGGVVVGIQLKEDR